MTPTRYGLVTASFLHFASPLRRAVFAALAARPARVTSTRLASSAGGTWSRYASADHTPSPAG